MKNSRRHLVCLSRSTIGLTDLGCLFLHSTFPTNDLFVPIVGSVFSSVASKYDIMNDTMSLGIHRLWKDDFVSSLLPRLPPSRHTHPSNASLSGPSPVFKCLDVAGGTGDIALRILDRAREKFGSRDIEVEIVDLNPEMLDEGRKRVAKTLYYNSELPIDQSQRE